MLSEGVTGKAQDDLVATVGLGDHEIFFPLVSQLQPPRPESQRQYVSKQQTEQNATVIPITSPKVRLFLDAPQPFEAEFSYGRRSSPYCSRLKIHRGTDLSSDRSQQTMMIAQQPQLSFLVAQG